MNKSARITLIRTCAAQLMNMSFAEASLILLEFCIPEPRDVQNDLRAHYLTWLRAASDAQVWEIAKHFGITEDASASPIELVSHLWEADHCRVFLSHTSANKKLATKLKDALLQFGCHAFVAHEDINPTSEWLKEIELALGSCHCVVALLTEDFHMSKWTDHELGFALGRQVPILPLRAGLDPYGLIGKIQAITLAESRLEDVAGTIFQSLNKHAGLASVLEKCLVLRFLGSWSFAEAKERIKKLEDLKSLTPESKELLKAEALGNHQIAEAHGVPERLDKLLKSDA